MTAAFEGFTRLIRLQGGFGVPEPPAERAGNPADFKDFWEADWLGNLDSNQD